ncbi:hypothetical protein ASPWEDRAFT_54982 [Aspergillus wentii DTO 134E9]|uniref:RED-like N-terminal domain-containing protein n=1 Tax=Aspergillus wentii DTO 134E9 TaxID=1073089 RepID=A0A1L9R643_ASPWE|nr:uncharacterized protein ASPWEDRAFT_54982 [Aspergillus wentii DTO 134E9]KAI9925134.1 hypothetical protein MW887_006054 [Aspergillus wentii]OJJ30380.1 hypothetical protein ASPWEDRAFT_54982 [Aspergillus wentii DTO 134E9]
MNNEQFRRLLVDNASSGKKSGSSETPSRRDGGHGGATPGAMLGSRMRSSIPMTPRSVTGADFARQLAEQRRDSEQPPSKRFKSTAAPKGTKLPTGYQDRAQKRQTTDEGGEDIEKRIQALEEMVKLGQIDQATFDKLRRDLGVGGDTKSTHMVKGLDWDLLKRVKAGDDVSKAAEKPAVEEKVPETVEDVDDEFDRMLDEKEKGVLPTAPKEKKEKKGSMAPPPAPAGKRSRDEILKQLKASRAAAAAQPPRPAEPELGAKFKKFGESKPEKKRFVEQDENGRRREVLVITDAQGNTKRKTRWLDKPGESNGNAGLLVPDKDAKPLGMEVPAEIAAKAAAAAPLPEDEDDDIFAGVGADYNPLADIGDGSSSDESDEDGEVPEARSQPAEKASISESDQKPATQPSRPRNYFSTPTTVESEPQDRSNPLTKDPTILAALKRAAALRQTSPSGEAEGDDVDKDSLLRQKKFLEEARRRDAQDAMDMDMGFGGSRNEDEEDEETVFFEEGRGGNKRKRGPKKRKGDKDSASDVMGVLEGRNRD